MKFPRHLGFLLILPLLLASCGCTLVSGTPSKATTVFGFNPSHRFGSGVGLGLGHYHFSEESIGYFVEGKSFFSGNVSGFEYHSQPAGSAGDPVTGEERNGASVNGGLTWMPSAQVVLYGGAGFGYLSVRQERFDANGILGPGGFYHFGEDSEIEPTFVVGGLYLIDRWILQLGYDVWADAGKIGFGLEW